MNKTGEVQNGSVTVISRNNGWLTVDPKSMSRKNAFEKKMKGDIHQASLMSPQWMQQSHGKPDKETIKQFKGLSAARRNLRCESNRILMIEKNEPPKSIFNLGQTRHNFMTKEDNAFQETSKR